MDGAVPRQPGMSPDGRWVAYVVAPVGKLGERRLSALWIAAADGSSPPRQLTAGTAADSGPRWAPDSASLFLLKVRTPVLIVHGEDDANVPLGQAIYFHRALRHYGAEHELVIYPREGHGLAERNHQRDLFLRTRAWFDRWLGGS